MRQALGGEPTLCDRLADRASGLALVAAVAETAAFSERLDIGEGGELGLRRERQGAKTRRIDHAGAARQREQGALGRGVSTLAVPLAKGAGATALLAEQRIEQGGFTDARRAEQHHRRAWTEIRSEQRGGSRAHADRALGQDIPARSPPNAQAPHPQPRRQRDRRE